MKQIFFHTCILIFIAIIVSSIGALLSSPHFLLNFVNLSFYIALVFVIVGGFLFLFQNGFFNVTMYAFQKVFGTNKKIESLIEELEAPEDKKERIYKTYSFKWTYPICLAGLLLAALSTLISVTILM
ncbi:DUF3899 domain-containing protein [Bacillus cytotoxicus]|uniref:DUF3899 domain-containing protein n=1 Tax=Bacillus cytotoxicus TaxID=580165 RepID=UPI000863CE49|nr:DUF3899 domain-containing protein [Bacillus cytotoxicus]AWC27875.1 DUF3899 domain-containing protein [Bacillus cytotoxicus]AWC40744.1 DUF3899 domain-containing protein [Bacillus cytotoxicus]AWC48675.1 DUF3899 domain-containing protein [Bacillus cytotoxicus]AWC51945.1 DUF3899 domain-containing protein [Bacillus cytotoxicus]AWC56074.1 DUF3899 domain-containing protein [Bacillus cytotoxicus]